MIFTITCLCRAAILRVGNPLNWMKSKSILRSVRYSGVQQFINHYKRTKDLETPTFLWGDEIEFGIFSRKSDRFDLSLRGAAVRQQLEDLETDCKMAKTGCTWQPEYGAWMVEAVPRDRKFHSSTISPICVFVHPIPDSALSFFARHKAYGGFVSDLLAVEKNMQV